MSENLRKSPFGRTLLFHSSADVVFKELQCAASVTQRSDGGSRFHTQGCGPGRACWHCCHAFDGDPIRLPRVYEADSGTYHVYGNFCTLGCAKAHLSSLPQFNREQHMYVFKRMAREVYGVDDVLEAPPRVALHMFGGPFSIQEFRQKSFPCVLHMPPFVSYCMVVEEKLSAHIVDSSSIRGMRIPGKTKMQATPIAPDTKLTKRYEAFCRDHGEPSAQHAEVVKKKQRVAEATAPVPNTRSQGGLSSFIRQKDS